MDGTETAEPQAQLDDRLDAESSDEFTDRLFGRVPAEDIAAYPDDQLTRLSLAAEAHLRQPRLPGMPDLRLDDVVVTPDGVQRELTVLEVVNDDVPYLLDSTLAELVARGIEPKLVAHPILRVRREPGGEATLLPDDGDVGGGRESLIHIHMDRLVDRDARASLVAELGRVYADVAVVARDVATMREQVGGLAGEYRLHPPPLDPAEIAEATAFLEWLLDGRFVLLGLRAYRLPEEGALDVMEGSGLGLLADPAVEVLKRGGDFVSLTPEIRAFLETPRSLLITKASVKSRVHRRAYLDFIGAKLFSPSGKLWGELAIVGLFTGAAYTSPAAETPYLRRKLDAVQARTGFEPSSFDGRALADILETYPRDELFQIEEATLQAFALSLLRLTEHPRIRVLARVDRFDRFVSLLVYVPKDRYDSRIRAATGAYLARSYGGRVSAAYPAYPDGPLARTHYIIGRDGGATPEISRDTLERGVAAIVRTWDDQLGDALGASSGPRRGGDLAARYAGAFGADYRERFGAADAIGDIATLERLSDSRMRAVDLYRREDDPPSHVNLKLFSRGIGSPLSERVPILEQLGFQVMDERTYRVTPQGSSPQGSADPVWLHDVALARTTGQAVDIAEIGGRIEAALLAVFRGLAEPDGFNKLVLEAGLGWRDAAMFRTLGRYLRQIGIPFAQDYIADVLARHGAVAAAISGLFYARFKPHLGDGVDREIAASAAREALEALLSEVTSLDDDRILRRFLNLVEAALRTNFFRIEQNGLPVETIAFKFACAQVEALPRPRPLFEIFMNGPRVEGLHLRFGKVARGGLRWSDRPQDFRTEVLGLVKAQQVKNAVIVPVGAKGGFVPKRLPPAADRAAWMREGTEAYRVFIRTLLGLTDNLVGEGTVHPPDTVRYDADDPYLVVAADKGTATFSDVANAISLETGHWLGDAFASGGSNGYDHKAMGITARGAWEAVRRHFREMDVDIQRDPVTVAGVGDMSGDVFGNGMLLSGALRLVAAFDHRDIFLDPAPDAAISLAERQRLFALPRSSWVDYDASLISAGGGVFSRALKTIPLSPQVREALGFDRMTASPAEVIGAILRAPVGLLWFGGIGTYIRASTESDAEAGDRANDAVRITGAEIRAKVVGEGANLGVTQLGRIEAARHGVRLNTDAIDNSAGVNTSDVEVNIKIALAVPERDGRLDPAARNALLAEMTREVGHLVLRNNYLQTLALSLSERRGVGELGFLVRLMDVLETAGRLDRAIEFLPSDAAIEERRIAGEGLTRPELAVLLAYAKLALHDELLASTVPDDPYLGRELTRYFPAEIRERFPDTVEGHRLRREIIATQLANAIVNRGGPAIVTRLVDETGADASTIAAAYAATRDGYALSDIYAGIDVLDGVVPGQRQLGLYADVQDVMLSRIVWFIRYVDLRERSLDDVVGLYRDGIAEVAGALDEILPVSAREARQARQDALVDDGVPQELARRLADLQDLVTAPDIVLVARRTERPIRAVGAIHFALDGLFGLGALAAAAGAVPVSEHYDRLARDRAVGALAAAHRRLTGEVTGWGGVQTETAAGLDADAAVAGWARSRGGEVGRIRDAVAAIAASGLTVSKLSVSASLIGDLAKD